MTPHVVASNTFGFKEDESVFIVPVKELNKELVLSVTKNFLAFGRSSNVKVVILANPIEELKNILTEEDFDFVVENTRSLLTSFESWQEPEKSSI